MAQEHLREQLQDVRQAPREAVVGPGVSCFITSSGGQIIEGVVRDISDDGAGITSETEGLEVGQEVRVVFVVAAGQKVCYRGFVKHVAPDARHCGVEFTSGPEKLDPSYDPRSATGTDQDPDLVPRCRRCESSMEPGFLVDHTHVGRGKEMICAPQWAPGRPGRGATLRGGGQSPIGTYFRVRTYRCPVCGALESYASHPSSQT